MESRDKVWSYPGNRFSRPPLTVTELPATITETPADAAAEQRRGDARNHFFHSDAAAGDCRRKKIGPATMRSETRKPPWVGPLDLITGRRPLILAPSIFKISANQQFQAAGSIANNRLALGRAAARIKFSVAPTLIARSTRRRGAVPGLQYSRLFLYYCAQARSPRYAGLWPCRWRSLPDSRLPGPPAQQRAHQEYARAHLPHQRIGNMVAVHICCPQKQGPRRGQPAPQTERMEIIARTS